MPLHVLDDKIWFPPVEDSLEDGLLAIGGDLTTERLLAAYKKGIFPWYQDEVPLWWSPHPRFVLFPEELKVSKSMKSILNKGTFSFTTNKAFAAVINSCKETERTGQDGTWITDDVEQAYNKLHQLGYAHSAEAWMDGKLVGGLYGIKMQSIFFGESMFSTVSNASKFAFINYATQLQKEDIKIIDCQVYTSHLESLGARMISRDVFAQYLPK